MIAIATTMLVLISAFTVDFGLAYNSKRQLQTGADSASLAAAGKLTGTPGNCSAISSNTTAVDAAHATADAISDSNRAGRIPTDWNVACSADNKRVEVRYTNGGTTNTIFGALAGARSIASERSATAELFVPASVTGLRPYFVCISDAQALAVTAGSSWVKLTFPNAACGNQPGNWYTVDCPEDGTGNSTTVIANNTQNGCDAEITIVDTSAARDPITGAVTNSALETSLLLAACNHTPALSGPNGCLTGNTGNLTANAIQNAWDGLLGKQIALPVFKVGTVTGNGNGATYPIESILGVKVCAYQWQNKDGVSSDPDCAGIVIPSVNEDHLWLKYTSLQVSGSTRPSPNCGIGDPLCNFRSVRLIR
jgi:Flp pilus assembly protein TadG